MIVFSGPSGGGKTTTLYACLRALVAAVAGQRNLATLEDPIEVAVAGVSQSQANPAAGFTLELGLRSLLRQDPEVIAVGEIRDRTDRRGRVPGLAHGPPRPDHLPRRQRRGRARPALRHGYRALPAPQRPAGNRRRSDWSASSAPDARSDDLDRADSAWP